MKKLKAFTLMELMIGMIIGSIVVAFCYSAYRMISRQYMDYKKVKAQLTQIMQLNTALASDCSRAERLAYSNNEFIVKLDSVEIKYLFEPEYVLRREKKVLDSFFLVTENIQSVFVQQNEEGNSSLLTELSFVGEVFGEKEIFRFSKNYSADFLMQYEKGGNDGH